jgi:protein SCO1/2
MRSHRACDIARIGAHAATAILLVLAALPAIAQPAPLHGLRLQDQASQRVDPTAYRGRTLLLNFVFTGCSTTCPTQTLELAALRRSLPPAVRAQVDFLSVSVDPLADTPATLAAFARRMEADESGWLFATGAPTQIDTLVQRLAATDPRQPNPGPADHGTALYLFGPSGELLQRYAGVPVDRARLARELTEVVKQPLRTPVRLSRTTTTGK